MGLNKNDRDQVKKQAADHGYRPSTSDANKMVNGNGGSIKFSDDGSSVNINGSKYNSSSDTDKSKKWG